MTSTIQLRSVPAQKENAISLQVNHAEEPETSIINYISAFDNLMEFYLALYRLNDQLVKQRKKLTIIEKTTEAIFARIKKG
jgi:hypothetical protein